LTVKKVVFTSTLHLVQSIKVVLSQNKYIMPFMHDMKCRKESDARKKGNKEINKKKRRNK